MVFEVKYDLRHRTRRVAGGNWTVNDKEDIYSGVLRMDIVRIGFFLGELYGLSCCACDIGNSFLYEITTEKVYITAGPEFGANLRLKISNMTLIYGWWTSHHIMNIYLRMWMTFLFGARILWQS
jgi:hypothetical protein